MCVHAHACVRAFVCLCLLMCVCVCALRRCRYECTRTLHRFARPSIFMVPTKDVLAVLMGFHLYLEDEAEGRECASAGKLCVQTLNPFSSDCCILTSSLT